MFFDFVPKTEHFDSLKINAYKNQSLQVIQQIGIYAMQVHTNNTHTNVKAMSSFLDVKRLKKTGRVMSQGKGDIVHYTISDFALNWCVGLSMALISILEFAK